MVFSLIMENVMKRLFAIVFIIACTCQVLAEDYMHYIKYDGNKYFLLYSEKSQEHNGYYNQYFKKGEDFDSWTDMIAVQHFPNVYSPIDLAHNFREYLGQYSCPSSLWIDDDKNIGVLDFVLIDKGEQELPINLEFNVFKYIKSPDCGSLTIQYAKKYSIDDINQIEIVKKNLEKFRPKALSAIKNIDIPNVVNEDIGEINFNTD